MTAPEVLESFRLDDLFRAMIERDGSDVHVKVGTRPMFRVQGEVETAAFSAPTRETLDDLVLPLLSTEQRATLRSVGHVDLAYSEHGLGRFRVNVYLQRGTLAFVARRVRHEIPSFEALHLPAAIADLPLAPRGLVLVTGPAGSGKSTTLAAMIDLRNRTRPGHIITIEDPIEFLHQDHLASVSQREVGTDAESFAAALRGAPRQNPDVLVIGEMRDADSATAAVYFAETGHLVLSTLHSTNASQALDRVLHFLPAELHAEVQLRLSATLVGIVSQRLVSRADGAGLVPAVEVLRGSPRVRELIRRGELPQLRQTMWEGRDAGMQTFDDSLFGLYQAGLITPETALEAAESSGDLRLRMRAFASVGRTSS